MGPSTLGIHDLPLKSIYSQHKFAFLVTQVSARDPYL